MDIPRRKVLLSVGGVGTTLVGSPAVAAADNDTISGSRNRNRSHLNSNSDYILDREYWTNEDGKITLEKAELDQWEVTVYQKRKRNQVAIQSSREIDDVDIYVGKKKNATPPSGESIVEHGHSPDSGIKTASVTTAAVPNLYRTLASGKIPDGAPGPLGGTDWSINMGIQLNATALSAEADLSVQVGASEVTLWSVGISYGDNKGFCTDVSPGQFPLAVEPCIDLKWDGQSEITVGGSVDLCTPPEDLCGRWLDCQYCLGGVGISETFNW